MRYSNLFVLVFCTYLAASPVRAGDNERLWYQQSLEDGGDLKQWMMQKSIATEEGFTCGALLDVAWKIAKKREVADIVSQSAQVHYTESLFEVFRTNNNLPCETLATEMTWTQFGEIGRLNGGYTPFTAAEVAEAKATAEASAQETLHAQATAEQAETATNGLVYHVPEVPPAPSATDNSPVSYAAPTSRSTRIVARQMDGTIRRVIPSGTTSSPTEAEIDAFIKAEAEAERRLKEAEAEARLEAVKEATYDAERERLREEAEVKERREHHKSSRHSSRSGVASTWFGVSSTPTRSKRSGSSGSHSEAFLTSYFHDIPEMVEVARCESTFRNMQSELRERNGRREKSYGFLQIHAPTWHDTAVELGLDNYQTDAMHNVLMARHVYEKQGWTAWKKCAKKIGLL